MVDPVRPGRIQEKELQADLARLQLQQMLKESNIWEVKARLPSNVTLRDFETFMGDQYKAWKSQIIQDYQVKENAGMVEEPGARYRDFVIHGEGTSLRPGEGDEFVKSMMIALDRKGGGHKGASASKAMKASDTAVSADDLSEIAEGTLSEWDEFNSQVWGQIFDAQMLQDYQQKMGEIKAEVDRIISLAKSGQVDPEYVLIALAKVNVTKNGVLMTWLGKKAFATNENMNRIANDLSKVPTSDPNYYSQMQSVQAKTRDGAFQLQLLTSDMQKVMQDVASVLEQVHSFMGEINRTRREIIQKFTAT